MNSMSKYYYKDDCDPCKKEKKEKKVCPTIIKCGCPGSFTLPVIGADQIGTQFPITSLSLDTSRLDDPCVKLEFAANIISTAALAPNLTFQVYKICNNQQTAVPVGPSWNFSQTLAAGEAVSFAFFICDCDNCSCFNDCCIYTVRVVSNTALAIGTSIANATLGAIATCSC